MSGAAGPAGRGPAQRGWQRRSQANPRPAPATPAALALGTERGGAGSPEARGALPWGAWARRPGSPLRAAPGLRQLRLGDPRQAKGKVGRAPAVQVAREGVPAEAAAAVRTLY